MRGFAAFRILFLVALWGACADDSSTNPYGPSWPGSDAGQCSEGYQLSVDGSCVDLNECAIGTSSCSPFAQCINTQGSFDCKCNIGYFGDGYFCSDLDECAQGTVVCPPNASCQNLRGGATCVCDPGFEGDGTTCTSTDACQPGPGQLACSPYADCVNQNGNASCVCKPGYQGSGTTCSDINECAAGPPLSTCSPNAVCTNTDGGHTCACKPGFSGDGVTCVDNNECTASACSPNATCSNTPGGFSCTCNPGYQGDGVTCTDINECTAGGGASECNSIAHCVNTIGGHYCVCPGGYSGNGVSCQAMTNCTGPMLDGIDVSSHQGTINWQQVKDSGIDFAFIRVSYGKAYLDNKFTENWNGAKSVGIVRGPYQFFRMKHDPIEQAEVMLSWLGGAMTPGDLPPVIDIEHDVPQYDDTYYSPAQWRSAVNLWINHVESHLGVKPIIYASYGFINWLNTSEFSDYPLWEAYWGVSCPSIPNNFDTWVFWQDSATGSVPGISGNVDTNHFNGTLEQLQLMTW